MSVRWGEGGAEILMGIATVVLRQWRQRWTGRAEAVLLVMAL